MSPRRIVIFPTRPPAERREDRLLQRSHHFEISSFHRKRIPVGLWLALEHFFQGVTKLGDCGPRIGRPGREPLLQQTVPIDVEVLTLMQAPPPPDVSCHAEDRAITVPGARRVATLLSPARLQQDQQRHALTIHHGISGRVRGVGLVGPLLKQFDRLAIRLDPRPQLRIADLRPGGAPPRDGEGVSFSSARRRNVKAF